MNISVALCTYNGAKFVGEQLESIRAQTVLPGELVICDDRSTDDTLSIIEKFAEAAPFPVRLVVNEQNLGSTQNFEKAIGLCSGDLIFLADQDDIWHSEKLDAMRAVFTRYPSVGLVFTDGELIDEDSHPTGRRLWDYTFLQKERKRVRPGEFYKRLASRNVVTGATAAFRREFLDDIFPFPVHIPNLVHDDWIALVISLSAEISFLDTPLISYRMHAGQQVGVHALGNPTSSAIESLAWTLGNLRNHRVALGASAERLQHIEGVRDRLARLEMELDEYSAHLAKRIELLQAGYVRRVPLIVREVLSGRYSRHSRALLSPLKDLLNR